MGILEGYVSEPRGRRPADGLLYSQANILIDRDCRARLADFGLLTMVSDQSTCISSWTGGGMIPWMSPELFDPERFGLAESRPTKESDCYALGMVIYEVLTGRAPFAKHAAPTLVWMVLKGERPGRPQGDEGRLFTDPLWETLQLCWKSQPSDRTNAEAVLLCLEGAPPLSHSSSHMSGDGETDTGYQSDTTAMDSGMFPVSFYGYFHSPSLFIELPVIHGGDGRPDSPCDYTPGVADSVIPPDDNPPAAPSKQGSSMKGWVGGVTRNARKLFKAISRKLSRLGRTRRALLR